MTARVRKGAFRAETAHRQQLSGPLLFALVYALYFGFGSINFVPRRGLVGMDAVWLIVLGLASYGLGVWVRTLLSSRTDAAEAPRAPLQEVSSWRPTAVFFGTVGALAAAGIIILFRGIPLFSGERRNEISAPLTAVMFVVFFAVAIVGGHALYSRRWSLLFFSVVGVLMLILLGYRTFILIPLGTIFFTARNLGMIRLRMRWWILGGFSVFGLSWLAFYRFDASKDAILRQYLVLGMPEKYIPFIPVWATPREGTSVFALLVEKFPETWDYLHGRMFVSPWLAALPGKQLGPRLEIAGYIGGRPGQSITPSILGQPYIDFGAIGIIVFMFFIGYVLKSIWIWQASSLTWAPKAASAFVLTVLLIDIHAGILDVQIIGGSAFMLWWASSAEARAKKELDGTTATPPRARQGKGRASTIAGSETVHARTMAPQLTPSAARSAITQR